jgi:carbon monoxide dehydrogenase subunit G
VRRRDGRLRHAAGAVSRACALLAGTVGLLGGAGPVPAADHDPVVAVADSGDVYRVRASLHVSVPPAIAWNVITDYDRIADFVSSMRASRAERGPDGLVVHQEVVAGVFPFRRRLKVSLAIDEDPGRRISFRDALGASFRTYQGQWRITPEASGTRVEYALDARPRAAFPRRIGRSMMSRSAQGLLQEVRDEMLRRAGPVGARADSSSRNP